MPFTRTCAACGGNDFRRSKRRGAWELLLSRVGILPYVCRTCRKRCLAFKTGALVRIAIIALLLIALIMLSIWFFGRSGGALFSQKNTAKSPAGADAAATGENPRARGGRSGGILLSRVTFGAGSAVLDSNAEQLLKTVAQNLNRFTNGRVLVEATPDLPSRRESATVSDKENLDLALARAKSVSGQLRALGVEPRRFRLAVSDLEASSPKNGHAVAIWLLPALDDNQN